MDKVVTSTRVAREFLHITKGKDLNLTPLKLMKLVFFAHGWCLGLTKKPLVCELVEAWPTGPVFPDLYRVIGKYGESAVDFAPIIRF